MSDVTPKELAERLDAVASAFEQFSTTGLWHRASAEMRLIAAELRALPDPTELVVENAKILSREEFCLTVLRQWGAATATCRMNLEAHDEAQRAQNAELSRVVREVVDILKPRLPAAWSGDGTAKACAEESVRSLDFLNSQVVGLSREVERLKAERDTFQASSEDRLRQIQCIGADRDQWKARVEELERLLNDAFAAKGELLDRTEAAEKKLAEAEKDTARLDWWLSDLPKSVEWYMTGIREHWSIERWKSEIDAAMSLPCDWQRSINQEYPLKFSDDGGKTWQEADR